MDAEVIIRFLEQTCIQARTALRAGEREGKFYVTQNVKAKKPFIYGFAHSRISKNIDDGIDTPNRALPKGLKI